MKDILIKTRNRFAAAALGCMVFAAVYECFSHGVFSPFMLLAFLFPLLMGAVPCTVLAGRPGAGVPSLYLYTSGVAALTAGSLFQGILVFVISFSGIGFQNIIESLSRIVLSVDPH